MHNGGRPTGALIVIDFDRDSISALNQKQERLWSKINEASFLTINEKRELVGLKPLKDGDQFDKKDNE